MVLALEPAVMRWASAVSTAAKLDYALDEASEALTAQLGGAEADLLVAFVSPHHSANYDRWPQLMRRHFANATLLGASAGGVLGAGRELEQTTGVALAAASLPGVTVTPFHFGAADFDTSDDVDWEQKIGVSADQQPHFLLLSDPFSFHVEPLLSALDQTFPGSTVIGGLASGASSEGGHALLLDDALRRVGLAGIALHGDIEVATVVAQGCRPIGQPLFVTATGQNRINALDGRLPLEVLRELFEELNESDRGLFRRALFLGVVMEPARQSYRPGDFLIRNIAGIDSASGALAVGAELATNSVVQFHLRDARTSAEELDALLARAAGSFDSADQCTQSQDYCGALLFSCLGRGEQLYGVSDHDSQLFARYFRALPLTGFFGNGEIGPVQGRTFLHSYTSAIGLFRPITNK